MSRQIRKIFSGYCPELDQQTCVAVTFAEINMIGSPCPGYKKTALSCEYAAEHGCKTCGSTGADCPIFRNANL